MIKEWSLKLNKDRKSYTLILEDDNYKWVLPNVTDCFDENGFPKLGIVQAFPDKTTNGLFTITISDELENSEIKLKGESGAKKATVEDSAQIITQKLIESMKQVSKAMTVEDAQEFLDELTSKTGIKFNLIVPKKTNLEDLMELYASGNLQRIARDRIKFNGDVIQGDFGVQDRFKVINGRVVEEVNQVEKAVEKEIKWLKGYTL